MPLMLITSLLMLTKTWKKEKDVLLTFISQRLQCSKVQQKNIPGRAWTYSVCCAVSEGVDCTGDNATYEDHISYQNEE